MKVLKYNSYNNLDKELVNQTKDKFILKKDKNDQIPIYDSFLLFIELGFKIDDNKKLAISNKLNNKNNVDINDLLMILQYLEVEKTIVSNAAEYNKDYVNAFIALGGNENLKGSISKAVLLRTIEDFGIELSMNSFIYNIISSDNDNIDFETFCDIFENQLLDDNKSIHTFVTVY